VCVRLHRALGCCAFECTDTPGAYHLSSGIPFDAQSESITFSSACADGRNRAVVWLLCGQDRGLREADAKRVKNAQREGSIAEQRCRMSRGCAENQSKLILFGSYNRCANRLTILGNFQCP
jgi:hypothetical protein